MKALTRQKVQQTGSNDFSNNIPIRERLSGVYLKSIRYKEGYGMDGKAFQKLTFSFMVGEEWLNLVIKNPRKSNYDDMSKFSKEKLRVEEHLAAIQSAFLDKKTMKRIFLENEGFRAWAKAIKEELEKSRCWDKELEIKTLPRKDGKGATFPYFAHILRRKGDKKIKLEYTGWEKRLIKS